ncbi:MAG: hypothetical protein LBS60_12820 [Deltaproteobacteria bacterium]|jgi:TPR repeat protein|nr:hypothetical protein [Deltaproteobacteria bacterium]
MIMTLQDEFKATLKQAEQGDPDAQHLVAVAYFTGRGTARNQKLGLKWGVRAANNGSPAAQLEMGHMLTEAAHQILITLSKFNKSLGPSDKDLNLPTLSIASKSALKLARQNAMEKAPKNQRYSQNIVLQAQVKLQEGIKWYEKAAKNGAPMAYFELAKLYLQGPPFPYDPKKGFLYLDEAVCRDYTPAMLLMATIHYLGLNEVRVNRVKSFAILIRAASLGDPKAVNDLAQLLVLGEGHPEDKPKALQLILERGNYKDFGTLSNLTFLLYHGGNGLGKDRDLAVKLCQKMIQSAKDLSVKSESLEKLLATMLSGVEAIDKEDFVVKEEYVIVA